MVLTKVLMPAVSSIKPSISQKPEQMTTSPPQSDSCVERCLMEPDYKHQSACHTISASQLFHRNKATGHGFWVALQLWCSGDYILYRVGHKILSSLAGTILNTWNHLPDICYTNKICFKKSILCFSIRDKRAEHFIKEIVKSQCCWILMKSDWSKGVD